MSPHPSSCAALLSDPRHVRKLSTGCAVLDGCLGGGIDARGITEIAGAAGAGKTQLALQLMLQALLPPARGGLGGGSVFLHSDSPTYHAPVERLKQLAAHFSRRHAALGANEDACMQHIHCCTVREPLDTHTPHRAPRLTPHTPPPSRPQVRSADQLGDLLQSRVPELLGAKSVRLVVLDSIAALFRATGREDDPRERTPTLLAYAARLKQLSETFNVAVVVTNQMSDKPLDALDATSGLGGLSPAECRAYVHERGLTVPALGLAWSACANARIVLTRRETGAPLARQPTDDGAAPPPSAERCLHLVTSPRAAGAYVPFVVREDGVAGLAGGHVDVPRLVHAH